MSLSSICEHFKKPDTGLLIIRVSTGLSMVLLGLPKFLGGSDMLTKVGGAMEIYHITFAPLVWGLLAATVEVVGGVLFALGILFRPVAFLLFFTMLTAFLSMQPSIDVNAFGTFSHPWMLMWLFLGMLFVGPGNYSLGAKG